MRNFYGQNSAVQSRKRGLFKGRFFVLSEQFDRVLFIVDECFNPANQLKNVRKKIENKEIRKLNSIRERLRLV